MIGTVLLIVAIVCFAAAAINVKIGSLNLVASGLLALAVRELV